MLPNLSSSHHRSHVRTYAFTNYAYLFSATKYCFEGTNYYFEGTKYYILFRWSEIIFRGNELTKYYFDETKYYLEGMTYYFEGTNQKWTKFLNIFSFQCSSRASVVQCSQVVWKAKIRCLLIAIIWLHSQSLQTWSRTQQPYASKSTHIHPSTVDFWLECINCTLRKHKRKKRVKIPTCLCIHERVFINRPYVVWYLFLWNSFCSLKYSLHNCSILWLSLGRLMICRISSYDWAENKLDNLSRSTLLSMC